MQKVEVWGLQAKVQFAKWGNEKKKKTDSGTANHSTDYCSSFQKVTDVLVCLVHVKDRFERKNDREKKIK